MASMVNITLNGKEIEAPRGAMILEVARGRGIDVPTLCYHDAIEPYGVCRLCIVETSNPFPPSLRISCAQAVGEGMVIETESDRVKRNRGLIFELLLARSPDARKLVELAARYGVYESRFYIEDSDDNCVRCGRCVRVCREKIGPYALCFSHRGYERRVSSEFMALSQYCIGCGSCAQVCPTGAIRMEDEDDQRTIYTRDMTISRFTLERCAGCQKPFATRKYLDYVLEKADKNIEITLDRDLCPECARTQNTRKMHAELAFI